MLRNYILDTEVRRVIFIIETKHEKDTNALDNVRTLLGNRTRDFVTAVDEKNVIVVREVKDNETYDDLCKASKVIYEMLCGENLPKARIALGTIVQEIKDVSRSYKEARMALDVGKIFYNERNVVASAIWVSAVCIYQFRFHCVRCLSKRFRQQVTGRFR